MRRLFLLAACLSALPQAGAETICLRGPRGLIRATCTQFADGQAVNGPMHRIDSRLISFNGQVFERDENTGRVRRLTIDLRPGREGLILGATQPETIRQVLDHLQRMRQAGALNGRALPLADTVLRRHGRNPDAPLVPGGTVADTGVRTGRSDDHGQGTAGGDPGFNRPTVDGNFFGGDGNLQPAYCQDLQTAVCNGTDRRGDEQKVQSKANQVLGLFRNLAKVGFNQFQQGLGGVQFAVDRLRSTAFPDANASAVFKRLMSFLASGVKSGMPTIENVRQILIRSIDSMDFAGAPGAKELLKDKAARTKINLIPTLNDTESIRAFVEGCGPDGMAPTAFALPNSNSLTVCPGLLISGAAKGFNGLYNVLHVVAHELGHDLDIPLHGFFGRLERCFTDVFRGSFLPKQTAESIADTIGAAAIAGQVVDKTPAQTLEILQQSVNILCFTTGRERDPRTGRLVPGEHPSGAFRINNIVGRNPGIMKALGCGEPTDDKPVCLTQGRVPAR